MNTTDIKPVITLRLKGDQVFFGPGIAQLLTAVEATGSVREGAAAMGVSYSKAWKILNTVETELGQPLLLRAQGGRQGGHSGLTPLASALLNRYQQLNLLVNQEVTALLTQLFPPGEPLDDQWGATPLTPNLELRSPT